MSVVLLIIIGLCFGSFLNVLIDRIPIGKSVLFGRSQCDFCKKQLSVVDLIPVVSYISLKGKCRYCHKKLSLQYPLVEITTSILFVVVFYVDIWTIQPSVVAMSFHILLVSIAFALAVMDIKYHILADSLLFFFALFSGIYIFLTDPITFSQRLFIGIVSAVPLLLIFLVTKGRGMGFGDVKLVGILGFLLSFPNILIAYYIAFLTGAVAGVILILGGKKKFRGTEIAFGPFLFIGAVSASLFGNYIWTYVKFFLGL